MKVFIVYCHPNDNSFTHQLCMSFIKGLEEAGHEITVSDLYQMQFNAELSESEYLKETFYQADAPVAQDVKTEQQKIQTSDAIVFIYPVFWTEAPAKLVGWFDRVWTTGFAYAPNPSMKTLEKALVLACAGKSRQSLIETGELQAMETVMLGDRIRNRAKQKEMVIFDNITHWDEALADAHKPIHLARAYQLGKNF